MTARKKLCVLEEWEYNLPAEVLEELQRIFREHVGKPTAHLTFRLNQGTIYGVRLQERRRVKAE